MSFLKKRWQIFDHDQLLAISLAAELNISPITSQILINRNIKSAKDGYTFLNPRLDSLSRPFDIPNMKKAIDRILEAKQKGEKVTVFGDYDVDGVTGTSIMLESLKKLGIPCDYYIPHRYNEGYGMNRFAIEKIHKEGSKIVLTVDCGISNYDEIEFAGSLGIDVIITDHHNIPEKLPKAYSIVNPKMIAGDHESKQLSGAGVAFKFAWALFSIAGVPMSELKDLLDLVALGTISDVVPLTHENRTLTIFGLKKIEEKKRIGLNALINAARINGSIGTREIGFGIGPRLNAAGRLKDASLSVELLTTNDIDKANEISLSLCRINIERQDIGSDISKQANDSLGDNPGLKKLIFAKGQNWHPGVIGIVAGRIAENYNRPTILVGINDGFCRGSARSIENFDIYNLLLSAKDLFIDFGGHKDAAGFEIKEEDLDELEKRLHANIEGSLDLTDISPKIKIDSEIGPQDMNMKLALELASLKPFGTGNPSPVFVKKGVSVLDLKRVGSDKRHLKARFSEGTNSIDIIGFGLGKFADNFDKTSKYDIVHTMDINEWQGYESVQLGLIDARISEI